MIAATVPPLIPDKFGALKLRILSALILVPPILAVLYAGSPYSDGLILLASGILAWEWARMSNNGTMTPAAIVMIGTVVATLVAGIAGSFVGAWLLVAAGALVVGGISMRLGRGIYLWQAGGVVYIGLACLGFIWLRADAAFGRDMIFWLIAVVSGTDIGAYFAGRVIGGPRIAPSISPKKTWAGLVGGILAAVLVGLVAAKLMESAHVNGFAFASGALAVIAQGGDFFESALKRRFHTKDSSNLIPGHGGLLDRLDGLLACSLVVATGFWLMGVYS